MRVAVLTTVLALLPLLSSGQAQEATAMQELRHDVRMNKVWTATIRFDTCGITVDAVYIMSIDKDGRVGQEFPARRDYIQLQWTKDIVGQPGYTLLDLISEFGQRLYVMRLHGTGILSGAKFVEFLWVSPIGVAAEPIGTAPVRAELGTIWADNDLNDFRDWYLKHTWASDSVFTEFEKLLWKQDARVELPIKLSTEGCRVANSQPMQKEIRLQW